MEIDEFMNSKRLFKDIRKRPKAQWPAMPVTVHINYHPDKHERMKVGARVCGGGVRRRRGPGAQMGTGAGAGAGAGAKAEGYGIPLSLLPLRVPRPKST